MSSGFKLTFCGAAETVTGSNFLVETESAKILIDCGIEQGRDYVERDAYGPFPYDPATIDALVITHAHLDHVGRCPKLAKDGFCGRVFMTEPTRDLTELILRDSAHIMAEDAQRKQLPPLFDDKDVDTFLRLIETVPYHEEKEIASGLSIYLRNTGHILGSASVRIKAADGTALALTGDIGNSPSPLLPDWEAVPDADVLLMESVYGDRAHPPKADRDSRLKDTLKRAIEREGAILIPAFSIERTQLMLYELSNFFDAGDLPKIPVFLDSPLAIAVTEVYEKWGPTYFKPEAEEEMKRETSLFRFPFLTTTKSREESMDIEKTPNPKIIIAGAGMSHGGRIGRHEQRYLPDPTTTLFTVGYQAPGSPGRMIQEGAPSVRIEGREVENRAHIEVLEGWSGHADREGLLDFAEAALKEGRTKLIFTALGEPSSERFLAQRIHDYLGGKAIVPTTGDSWQITKDSVRKL
ncbi:MAG TPA: MBL fold metallo-hydrolase [Candidatus Paceibacterota bacterium]|nr:MBL fold metallo-hydrolase [Candidatus Paceibacterota bacterium]